MLAAAVSGSDLAATNADADSDDATATASAAITAAERHLLLRGRYFFSQVHTYFRTG